MGRSRDSSAPNAQEGKRSAQNSKVSLLGWKDDAPPLCSLRRRVVRQVATLISILIVQKRWSLHEELDEIWPGRHWGRAVQLPFKRRVVLQRSCADAWLVLPAGLGREGVRRAGRVWEG